LNSETEVQNYEAEALNSETGVRNSAADAFNSETEVQNNEADALNSETEVQNYEAEALNCETEVQNYEADDLYIGVKALSNETDVPNTKLPFQCLPEGQFIFSSIRYLFFIWRSFFTVPGKTWFQIFIDCFHPGFASFGSPFNSIIEDAWCSVGLATCLQGGII